MKQEVLKEIIYDLQKAREIISVRSSDDAEELRKLSDHAIEDVAVYKDLDLISVTVFLYSLSKVIESMGEGEYKYLQHLERAQQALQVKQLGKYNQHVKNLYKLVHQWDSKVKTHLQDVMQAARIKKSSLLVQRGLSIGQAAGLMGLSNWDLQPYAGKTIILGEHTEKIPAKFRLARALKIFNL
jgi:hypothetical protein